MSWCISILPGSSLIISFWYIHTFLVRLVIFINSKSITCIDIETENHRQTKKLPPLLLLRILNLWEKKRIYRYLNFCFSRKIAVWRGRGTCSLLMHLSLVCLCLSVSWLSHVDCTIIIVYCDYFKLFIIFSFCRNFFGKDSRCYLDYDYFKKN